MPLWRKGFTKLAPKELMPDKTGLHSLLLLQFHIFTFGGGLGLPLFLTYAKSGWNRWSFKPFLTVSSHRCFLSHLSLQWHYCTLESAPLVSRGSAVVMDVFVLLRVISLLLQFYDVNKTEVHSHFESNRKSNNWEKSPCGSLILQEGQANYR